MSYGYDGLHSSWNGWSGARPGERGNLGSEFVIDSLQFTSAMAFVSITVGFLGLGR